MNTTTVDGIPERATRRTERGHRLLLLWMVLNDNWSGHYDRQL